MIRRISKWSAFPLCISSDQRTSGGSIHPSFPSSIKGAGGLCMCTSPPCSGHHVVSQPYIIFTASAPPSRPYGRAAGALQARSIALPPPFMALTSSALPRLELSQVKWMALTSSAAMAMGRRHSYGGTLGLGHTFRMAHLGVDCTLDCIAGIIWVW